VVAEDGVGGVTGSAGSRLYWGLALRGAGVDSSAASRGVLEAVKKRAAQSSWSKKRFMEGLSGYVMGFYSLFSAGVPE
jgi:hypothetical protein